MASDNGDVYCMDLVAEGLYKFPKTMCSCHIADLMKNTKKLGSYGNSIKQSLPTNFYVV